MTLGGEDAFQRAADPKAFPEQISHLGLKPWTPAKLYTQCNDKTQAQVSLDMNEITGRLQASAREFQDRWPARIEDHLPPPGRAYSRSVVLLCNVDLELRWRTSREGRAAEYFRRFPEVWDADVLTVTRDGGLLATRGFRAPRAA